MGKHLHLRVPEAKVLAIFSELPQCQNAMKYRDLPRLFDYRHVMMGT